MKRQRRREMDEQLQDWIELQALLGYSANQIYKLLEERIQTEQFGKIERPKIWTVQRIVKNMEIKDNTMPWNLCIVNNVEDARLIFDFLAELINWSGGRKYSITDKEADMVLRVKKATLDLDGFLVWILAKYYHYNYSIGDPSNEDLDMYIALTPWRSWHDFNRYTMLAAENKAAGRLALLLFPITLEKHSKFWQKPHTEEESHERSHSQEI